MTLELVVGHTKLQAWVWCQGDAKCYFAAGLSQPRVGFWASLGAANVTMVPFSTYGLSSVRLPFEVIPEYLKLRSESCNLTEMLWQGCGLVISGICEASCLHVPSFFSHWRSTMFPFLDFHCQKSWCPSHCQTVVIGLTQLPARIFSRCWLKIVPVPLKPQLSRFASFKTSNLVSNVLGNSPNTESWKDKNVNHDYKQTQKRMFQFFITYLWRDGAYYDQTWIHCENFVLSPKLKQNKTQQDIACVSQRGVWKSFYASHSPARTGTRWRQDPRGIYIPSIGHVAPTGKRCFLHIRHLALWWNSNHEAIALRSQS